MVQISKKEEEHVSELHEKIPFVNASDTTTVVPLSLRDYTRQAVDTNMYIEKLIKGGINIVHLAFLTWPYDFFYQAIKNIAKFYRVLDDCKDDLLLVTSYEDVKRAVGEGKVGAIMHFHSSTMIDDNIDFLSVLKKLGLRVMQLTYFGRNLVGDGSMEKPEISGGLSSFGYKFVEEMNRLHILVDLAHSGPKTYMDALEFSKDPIVNSHGCVQALGSYPESRGLNDKQIHALAEKGGVMGIMAKHLKPRFGPKGEINVITMDDYMKHLEYVIDLVGVDYVGIGTEAGEGRTAEDLFALSREVQARQYRPASPQPITSNRPRNSSDRLKTYTVQGTETVLTLKRNLLRELVGRGYSDQEITKILSGNFFRIYQKIW
jgi:membrane dipeptidase